MAESMWTTEHRSHMFAEHPVPELVSPLRYNNPHVLIMAVETAFILNIVQQ